MSSYTDFKDGLTSIDQYLAARHHINEELVASPENELRVVLKSENDFNMREILCNLLAGNGLKLPNLQVCMHANLNALLGTDTIQQELLDAIQDIRDKFEEFMDHTNLENLLARINKALDEVTQVANMINFCATPIDPKAIPNVLQGIMESYLGAGEFLINQLGEFIPDEVSACLSSDGSFNVQAFQAGVLGDIANNWDKIASGQLLQSEIDQYKSSLSAIKDDFDTLMRFENNVAGYYSQGGSATGPIDPDVNKGMGVLHNPESGGIARNAQLASMLKTSYDRLAGYPVVDGDGNEYENIFELFLEPDMVDILKNETDPTPTVTGPRQPVYNYCDEVIGYTEATLQQPDQIRSQGLPPTPSDSPGYNAGGLPTQTDGIQSGAISTQDDEGNPNSSADTGDELDLQTQGSSRKTVSLATGSITPGDSSQVTIEVAKAYMLMKVSSNVESRVRLYSSASAQSADLSRALGSPPGENIGLVFEGVFGVNETKIITPGVLGFNEDANTNGYVTVTNESQAATEIEISFVFLPLES